MAITTPESSTPLGLPSGETPARRPLGAFTRPQATTGWRSWFTTIDHKKIGILYGATALFFFFIGGLEALLIRAQLAQPDGQVLTASQYNQVFTMHGTTMIFLVVMPLSAAFANYLIPLQIGARDVAFPRLNAFSYWALLAGGLVLNAGWLLGGSPDNGWFNYAPNSGLAYSPGHGIDFWNMGLILTGISSLVGAINLIVTCLNMRAPGMTLMRMPVFTWMALVTQFLLLFAIPVLTVAQFLLMFERLFGAQFFDPAAGADPLLWQHLFWIFGHPEVYIMILPAFGIVSEIIPVFARKPLFGYPFMVFSGIAIGFMGWGVWAHHMFVSGLGPVSVAAFSLSTMFIAVPTGVKIFNWVGSLWGGKLRLTVPMAFAIALVAQFTVGGVSGVSHAVSPSDTQQTDTYYIVAHFHYVLFGGALFGLVGGLYFWWPKIFGRHLRDRLGWWHFWLMVIGFNLTFGPMHIVGLQGMPRRTASYAEDMGWDFWNLIETVGAFIIGVSFLVFAYNIIVSRNNPPAAGDPWDGRSLEWATTSPPPVHNFDEIRAVTHLDDWWHQKYREDDGHRLVREPDVKPWATPAGPAEPPHLPSPSYWPLVLALGLPFVVLGLLYSYWLVGVGAVLAMAAIYGWVLEPSVDPAAGDHGHDDHDDDHDGGDGDGNGAEADPELVVTGAPEGGT